MAKCFMKAVQEHHIDYARNMQSFQGYRCKVIQGAQHRTRIFHTVWPFKMKPTVPLDVVWEEFHD